MCDSSTKLMHIGQSAVGPKNMIIFHSAYQSWLLDICGFIAGHKKILNTEAIIYCSFQLIVPVAVLVNTFACPVLAEAID